MPPPASTVDQALGKWSRPLLRVDLRRAAELAHPDDQRRIEQAAGSQVFHQGGPGRVEDVAQALDGVEVLLVRVPADAVVVHTAQGDLDERHAALDQPAGQQAALAEQVAAIGIAHAVRLLFQVERLGRGRAHQPHGPVVGRLMAHRRQSGMPADEIALHVLQQADAGVGLSLVDAFGRHQVLDAEGFLVIVLPRPHDDELVAGVADEERRVLRPQEAGAVGRRAEEPDRARC